MTLKAVILDLDDTLIDAHGHPVDGVIEMIEQFSDIALRVVVASNRPGAVAKLARAGISPDFILDRTLVGSAKGSPAWVDRACLEFDIERHEIVWLGDSDLDMRSAVNAKVAYFNAGWTNRGNKYGLQMARPELFEMVIRECFAKLINWFAWKDMVDQAGRPVVVRSMTDSFGGGDSALERQLRQFLKERQDFQLGPYDFGISVTLHLLGSLYGSGIAQTTDTWTIYPGSRRTSGPNAALAPFVSAAAKLFRDYYVGDLLIRHTDSLDSGQTRFGGGQVDFFNQINTVCLNPQHRLRIEGKNIVVVDDFETNGNSLECARNLLLQAGAETVTCVSIGKYHMRGRGISRNVLTPTDGHAWDPYAPTTHTNADFRDGPIVVALDQNPRAPAAFRDSIHRIAQWPD